MSSSQRTDIEKGSNRTQDSVVPPVVADAGDAGSELSTIAEPTPEKQDRSPVSAKADPNIVGWDGPDDPYNPQNWSPHRKWIAMTIVSCFTFMR